MSDNIYIPIGTNCTIANFLRDKKFREHAFPFDWNLSSLESVYNVLFNDFEGFLDDIYVGKKIKRMFFEDNILDVTVHSTEIYPVICKKYNILFPHDYVSVDSDNLSQVKNKYLRRINRFREMISNTDNKIFMIYDFQELNDWQKSVFQDYNNSIVEQWKFNIEQVNKIKLLFGEKKHIQIMSLSELKKIS